MRDHLTQERFRRRYLPHLEIPGGCYFVTYRLAGTIPEPVLAEIEEKKVRLQEHRAGDRPEVDRALFVELDQQLDAGRFGARHLENPELAKIAVDALTFFCDQRLSIYAYCVMPNHVHAVIRPLSKGPRAECWPLESLMHSIKSFSGHEANKILGQSGHFWQREYFDRLMRDEDDLGWYMKYTLCNPVAAGLCRRPQDWPWSNAVEVYGA